MLAKNLATIRKVRGLTQAELAHQLRIDVSTISRWERGETGPPTTGDHIGELAKALDCEQYHLFHPNPLAMLEGVEEEVVAAEVPASALAFFERLGSEPSTPSHDSDQWSRQRRRESDDQADIA